MNTDKELETVIICGWEYMWWMKWCLMEKRKTYGSACCCVFCSSGTSMGILEDEHRSEWFIVLITQRWHVHLCLCKATHLFSCFIGHALHFISSTMVFVIRWTSKSVEFWNICHLSTLLGKYKSTRNEVIADSVDAVARLRRYLVDHTFDSDAIKGDIGRYPIIENSNLCALINDSAVTERMRLFVNKRRRIYLHCTVSLRFFGFKSSVFSVIRPIPWI